MHTTAVTPKPDDTTPMSTLLIEELLGFTPPDVDQADLVLLPDSKPVGLVPEKTS